MSRATGISRYIDPHTLTAHLLQSQSELTGQSSIAAHIIDSANMTASVLSSRMKEAGLVQEGASANLFVQAAHDLFAEPLATVLFENQAARLPLLFCDDHRFAKGAAAHFSGIDLPAGPAQQEADLVRFFAVTRFLLPAVGADEKQKKITLNHVAGDYTFYLCDNPYNDASARRAFLEAERQFAQAGEHGTLATAKACLAVKLVVEGKMQPYLHGHVPYEKEMMGAPDLLRMHFLFMDEAKKDVYAFNHACLILEAVDKINELGDSVSGKAAADFWLNHTIDRSAIERNLTLSYALLELKEGKTPPHVLALARTLTRDLPERIAAADAWHDPITVAQGLDWLAHNHPAYGNFVLPVYANLKEAFASAPNAGWRMCLSENGAHVLHENFFMLCIENAMEALETLAPGTHAKAGVDIKNFRNIHQQLHSDNAAYRQAIETVKEHVIGAPAPDDGEAVLPVISRVRHLPGKTLN